MKIQVFWNVTQYRMVNTFLGLLDPEDEDATVLRNVGNYLHVDTA
jgi:hypothetical protein